MGAWLRDGVESLSPNSALTGKFPSLKSARERDPAAQFFMDLCTRKGRKRQETRLSMARDITFNIYMVLSFNGKSEASHTCHQMSTSHFYRRSTGLMEPKGTRPAVVCLRDSELFLGHCGSWVYLAKYTQKEQREPIFPEVRRSQGTSAQRHQHLWVRRPRQWRDATWGSFHSRKVEFTLLWHDEWIRKMVSGLSAPFQCDYSTTG